MFIIMQISMNVLSTLTIVASMQCVAILWDRTPAHVKQDTQAMEGNALVSCMVYVCIKNIVKSVFGTTPCI